MYDDVHYYRLRIRNALKPLKILCFKPVFCLYAYKYAILSLQSNLTSVEEAFSRFIFCF